MRGRAISEEVKAQIMAALLAGDTVNELARKFNIPHPSVSRIKNEIAPEKLDRVGPEKRERIDSLLLECMNANVRALTRYADTTSEPEYIKKQPAECVAVLYREIAATTIRLLEAASAAGVADSEFGEVPD